MHIMIERESLAHAVSLVSKAVSSRTSIPILTGIQLSVSEEGCLFTGSDSDISIQKFIPTVKEDQEIIHILKQGSIVLPSKYFTEMVKKLPSNEVEIEVGDQLVTTIRAGQSEFQLNGLDAEEYPRLPSIEKDQKLSISADLLNNMIRSTSFAVSTQESRPILSGVLWKLEQEQFTLAATDSHRLAWRNAHVDTHSELEFSNVVVPGRSLNELSRILDSVKESVDIIITGNQMLVQTEQTLFYSRLLEGAYPDISRIIPKNSNTTIVAQTKSLLQAIERASLLGKDGKHVVKLSTTEKDHIEITSNTPEVGKLMEKIKVEEITGDEVNTAFNARYVLDALRALDSPEVQIEFTGAMSPFVLTPVDHDHILHLVTPVRTY